MTLARGLIYSAVENFLHFLSSPRAPFNLDNRDDDDDDDDDAAADDHDD